MPTLNRGDYRIYGTAPDGDPLIGVTSDGRLDTKSGLTVGGALEVAGNVAVATNKFTVAAASGNTVIAGTLAVTGAATFTGSISHATATNSGAVMVSTNTVAYTNTTAKDLFVLPAGAVVVDVAVVVTTAFNAGTGNVIIVGTAADDDKWVDDLDVSAAGVARMGATGMPSDGIGSVGTSSVTVKGKYTPTGTAPTAGQATVFLYWYKP